MKKLILLSFACFLFTHTYAQKINSDSLAYQLQRTKINSMLDARRQKFGQYEESLSMHTGIFGLQTKKDIRRSNDILMDIAKTDDNIFEQIKILLNYRIDRQQQVQTKSAELENTSLAYMNTINRLRNQIDMMKKDAHEAQQKTQRISLIVFVLMLGSILYLLFKKRSVKA